MSPTLAVPDRVAPTEEPKTEPAKSDAPDSRQLQAELDAARKWFDEHGHPVPADRAAGLIRLLQPAAQLVVASWKNRDVDRLRRLVDDPGVTEVIRSSAALALMDIEESHKAIFLASFPRDRKAEYTLAAVHNEIFSAACMGMPYPCGNAHNEALIRLGEKGDRAAIGLSLETHLQVFAAEDHQWIFSRSGPAVRLRAKQPQLLIEEAVSRIPGPGSVVDSLFFDGRCGPAGPEVLAEADALDALKMHGKSAEARDRITTQMRAFVGEDGCGND